MSSIKIVAMPPGEAPEWVRKEWVGIVISLATPETGAFRTGVHGGKSEQEGGYQVETETALVLLDAKSPEAADWFLQNALLASRLVFAKEVCEYLP